MMTCKMKSARSTNGPPPLAVGGVKVPVVVEGRRRRKLHALSRLPERLEFVLSVVRF